MKRSLQSILFIIFGCCILGGVLAFFALGKAPFVDIQNSVNEVVNGAEETKSFPVTNSVSHFVFRVNPEQGSMSGGDEVRITGSSFQHAAKVFFDKTEAQNVTWISETELQATTPAHALGSVSIIVEQQGVRATLHDGFTYQ